MSSKGSKILVITKLFLPEVCLVSLEVLFRKAPCARSYLSTHSAIGLGLHPHKSSRATVYYDRLVQVKSVPAAPVVCLISVVVRSGMRQKGRTGVGGGGSSSFWGQWTKLLCPNFSRDTLQSVVIMRHDKVGGEQTPPYTVAPVCKRNKEILRRRVKVSWRLLAIFWGRGFDGHLTRSEASK